jgi:c(7)-type cytochrome triheme protein
MNRTARLLFAFLLIVWASMSLAQGKGVKKRRPLPDQFGNVVMNNLSEKNGVAPVVFSHWLHRAKFTCRLCHVDIAFAMQANATQVREEDNRKGFYCGACHNGKVAFAAQTAQEKNCDRCHSAGKDVPHIDFAAFTADLPRGRFGNNVDWEAAELDGKIKLADTLPGVSVKRKPLEVPKDYSIEAKINGLPEIVFSHKKHAVWNGCELCHPDIYSVKTGTTKYTMEDVFAGKFCGVCHGPVAFPAIDCQRCHTKPVTG